jgi:hypothetical protein
MGDVINAGGRFRGARIISPAAHKFAVGMSVIHRIGHRSEKAFFRIVRQLPDGGHGLQYRLKSAADGHERVALEATLESPAPEDIAT